ncbi:MAG: hypothetical protein FWE48_02625 [Coriobacteriia bacterium]|nr:hypothetical protein [Coriobacteriia bacterium]MCL2745976.1 hypothetical protein [Coriobacteriia bacterium]MCL2870776.1 hypothetical protein [Coriobacteriia bacterium]
MKITLTIDPKQSFGQTVQQVRQVISETASDTEALANPHMITVWSAGAPLSEGQLVRRLDQVFRVLQAHTARPDWMPGHTPDFYREIVQGSTASYEPWQAGRLYSAGERVAHAGRNWESAVNSNHWEPGSPGIDARIWKEVISDRFS